MQAYVVGGLGRAYKVPAVPTAGGNLLQPSLVTLKINLYTAHDVQNAERTRRAALS
jgi:hypothetical protein